MRCAFCGIELDAADLEQACSACPFTHGCRLVKCPNCGYETPAEARLLSLLAGWRGKGDGSQKGTEEISEAGSPRPAPGSGLFARLRALFR